LSTYCIVNNTENENVRVFLKKLAPCTHQRRVFKERLGRRKLFYRLELSWAPPSARRELFCRPICSF
jgi:hypothetical protein